MRIESENENADRADEIGVVRAEQQRPVKRHDDLDEGLRKHIVAMQNISGFR